MTRLKFPTILTLLWIGFLCASVQTQNEESIFQCSQLTDLTTMSNCFRKRFSEMSRRASTSNHAYPYHVAPQLPSYLVPEVPTNNLATKRFGDVSRQQRRMQGFYDPSYRNFLDLEDSPVRRPVEYRPIFDVYVAPELLTPSHDPYNNDINTAFYTEPAKVRKQQNIYGQRSYDGQKAKHGDKSSADQRRYKSNKLSNNKDPSYNSYAEKSEYSRSNSYDQDYYVPANSPIIGDIRRSLFDYTGSFDLMADEPEYEVKESIIREMGSDYAPFQRTYSKPLPRRETRRSGNR